jgi:archaemetzincin
MMACLVATFAVLWHFSPPPSSGGSQDDSIAARWVKNRIYASVSPLDESGFTRLTRENANGWYGIFREPIQSFDFYKSLQPMRPNARRRTIVLQPLGAMNAEQQALLQELQKYCSAFFQLPVRVAPQLPLEAVVQWTRPTHVPGQKIAGAKQYDAGKLLDKVLLPRLPDDAAAYLGVTMSDLWADDLSFVFGLASVEHRTGVYSLCRYYSQHHAGRSTTQEKVQTLRRACLVLNHETGHMFGLWHCVLYKCAMNGSNSIADVDNTPLEPCPVCLQKLLWNIGGDGTKRYKELLRFYREYDLKPEARWTEQRLRNWRQLHPVEDG